MSITSYCNKRASVGLPCKATPNEWHTVVDDFCTVYPGECFDRGDRVMPLESVGGWDGVTSRLEQNFSQVIAKIAPAPSSGSGNGGFDLPGFSLPDIVINPVTPGTNTPPTYTPPITNQGSANQGSFLTSTAGMVTAGVAVVGLTGLLVMIRRRNARRAMPMSGLRRNKKGQFVKGRRGRKSVRGLGCTCTC